MNLFLQLPGYVSAYPDRPNPVLSVTIPPGQGTFAFVELIDEVVTSTLILMSGFELFGRAVRIGRPQGYEMPSYGELSALDLTPLRQCGLLPPQAEAISMAHSTVESSTRQLYIGNLSVGHVAEKEVNDLLLPICLKLPEYNPEQGPPITKIHFAENNMYCFVQFQNAEIASKVLEIFNDMVFFGRKLRVGRPFNYYAGIQAQYQTILEPLTPSVSANPTVPALPVPVPPTNAFVAGSRAATKLLIDVGSGK